MLMTVKMLILVLVHVVVLTYNYYTSEDLKWDAL